uniref:Uncharacterized protein n=1 Tax=Anopheles albimanus TaxID=7167 RepID=A0A182FDV2_ANOAL
TTNRSGEADGTVTTNGSPRGFPALVPTRHDGDLQIDMLMQANNNKAIIISATEYVHDIRTTHGRASGRKPDRNTSKCIRTNYPVIDSNRHRRQPPLLDRPTSNAMCLIRDRQIRVVSPAFWYIFYAHTARLELDPPFWKTIH